MAKPKKPQSVDEIVSEYQKYHHAAGKSFQERIRKFEEFHDPDNIHAKQFTQHAHYAVFGKPSDTKSFPGAYNEAYKVLDKHAPDDNAKLEDEDKLTEILEMYTDTFLQQAIGERYKEMLEHAGKTGKLSKKELREFKGQLMSQFYTDDEGRGINILADRYIKELKGKKKIELVAHLQGLGEQTKKLYASRLHQKAIGGLIDEDDRLDMAKYITPIFEEKGLKPKYAHITRSAQEQSSHYSELLQGGIDTLVNKAGYSMIKKEKKA